MPFSYSVDHRRQRIHAIGTGTITIADWSAYVAARVRDGVYDYDQLMDITAAQLDVATPEVVRVIKQARTHLNKKPIPFTAIVATPGNVTYGLTRQLATLFDFEGAEVQVAATLDEGHAWLDQMRAERAAKHSAEESR